MPSLRTTIRENGTEIIAYFLHRNINFGTLCRSLRFTLAISQVAYAWNPAHVLHAGIIA